MIKKKYSQTCINRIINNVSLIKVVGDLYVEPKTYNNKHFYFCINTPFDKDRKAKGRPFMISNKRRIFKCFCTGKSGNVINFVMLYLNINKRQAIQFLLEKYKIHEDTVETHVDVPDNLINLPF